MTSRQRSIDTALRAAGALWRRGWLVGLGVFATSLLLALLLLQRWLGSETVRDWAAGQLGAAAAAQVSVQRVALDLWPVPALALSGVALLTKAPLRVERVEVRAACAARSNSGRVVRPRRAGSCRDGWKPKVLPCPGCQETA